MHENAGNIGLRMDYFQRIIMALNVNILTVAYRGYSESEGYPTELGLKTDGLAIMNYTKENKMDLVSTGGKFYLLGRSLGGAVASYVATH
jgi:alpha/beta superfamily hydrolase